MIKFHEPYKSKRLKKNLNILYKNNSFGSTYFRDSCTELLKEKFNYKNFLLTNSATSALELMALLLKDLDFNYIKLPSYTFSSTANAFLRTGFNIEFFDIELNNLMIDIEKVNKTESNELFAVVHYAGSSFDFEKLNKNNLNESNFIEDASQSFGVKYKGQNLGQIGLSGCISFHPTKNVHSDFGGMAIFNEKFDLDKAKFIYERGTDRSKVISGLKNKYEWVEVGSSFEITESSSAILESQLHDYEKIFAIRKELYTAYVDNLQDLVLSNTIKIQEHPIDFEPNYHAFYIIVNQNRDLLIEYLFKNGVQAYIGYVPLHSSVFSMRKGYYKDLPITDHISQSVIRLPLHTNLNVKQIIKICNLIKSFFA